MYTTYNSITYYIIRYTGAAVLVQVQKIVQYTLQSKKGSSTNVFSRVMHKNHTVYAVHGRLAKG